MLLGVLACSGSSRVKFTCVTASNTHLILGATTGGESVGHVVVGVTLSGRPYLYPTVCVRGVRDVAWPLPCPGSSIMRACVCCVRTCRDVYCCSYVWCGVVWWR